MTKKKLQRIAMALTYPLVIDKDENLQESFLRNLETKDIFKLREIPEWCDPIGQSLYGTQEVILSNVEVDDDIAKLIDVNVQSSPFEIAIFDIDITDRHTYRGTSGGRIYNGVITRPDKDHICFIGTHAGQYCLVDERAIISGLEKRCGVRPNPPRDWTDDELTAMYRRLDTDAIRHRFKTTIDFGEAL